MVFIESAVLSVETDDQPTLSKVLNGLAAI